MKILILVFSEVWRDPRVYRQIQVLHDRYELTVVGFGRSPHPNVQFIQVPPFDQQLIHKLRMALWLSLRQYESWYWSDRSVRSALEQLGYPNSPVYHLVIANDVNTLPLSLKIAQGKPVLLDAHEFAPQEYSNRLAWRLLRHPYAAYLCRTYLPQIRAMTTVNDHLAQEYKKQFNIEPKVVMNTPFRQHLYPTPVQGDRIRLVHHGAAIPSRNLEDMIQVLDGLDERFTLDFILTPFKPWYLEQLKQLAAHNPRIHFREPVPMPEICQHINEYDIGIFLLNSNILNYIYCLPNKLFEYIQARLAIAIGPSPEMAKIVHQYQLGVVADSFAPQDLAQKLNDLTAEQIKAFKNASHQAAEHFCFEVSGQALLEDIRLNCQS
ncbi:hypothetical protein L3556_09920 [Candidatus Synechococcus calcipolaris G9]|uniref:Glycosyltransferase subfamily 4-like N-terminal domain-containing protein n=1 Tax=Candidatus Synechococcus calcipolaris G9 TaxID=1497997 RepID=A0ABT6F075_9SYNE|nr:hypothetical protein [Candidatus Synechococcus calcipolaris]MDG2991242.1 hypothetical protein [Candidatus Synechococcus calcipolaris G9]